MSENGWYYLHTNGSLIYKRFEPESDSPFVKRIWTIDTSNRANAWRIVLEAAALGASASRLTELARKWNITPTDLPEYMIHSGAAEVNAERKAGMMRLAEDIWKMDLDAIFDVIEATPKGGTPDMSGFEWSPA